MTDAPTPGDTVPGLPSTDVVVDRLRAAGCVFAEDEAALLLAAARDAAHLEEMVARRVSGLPLEPILGWAEFRGRRVLVGPGVFVPRARTALLVEEALRLAPPDPVVLDLCCGSGALGASFVQDLGPGRAAELHAADVEPAAVRWARRNVEPLGGTVHEGDLDAPLPRGLLGRVDVLLANVPYVPSDAIGTMPPEAREHEPQVTLDGGADGLDVLRRVAAVAPRWLAPGGHLLSEVSGRQLAAAVEVLAGAGLVARAIRSDDLGATGVVGTLPRG